MIIRRRRHGSPRAMKPLLVHMQVNIDETFITFKGEDDIWYMLVPETEAEMKQLLSNVHVIHHYWEDTP